MRLSLILLCLATWPAPAQDAKSGTLAEFSGALERLAATVAPAVVQVQVSAWCNSASAGMEDAGILTACRVVGSGVIVDPSGYIITNEHVVRNARRIRVMLTPKTEQSAGGLLSGKKPILDAVVMDENRQPLGKREVLDAAVVGASRDTDIALLKIEASGLPTIPMHLTGHAPRQGQFVLAVGSPEGLDNTMTSGIISSVGRQPHPDYPMLYIQTDAAINPGNSGGPLLDVQGELVGINTFMITDSGHNQGLGFAVPAAVVRYVYEQLRTHGCVRQSLVGVRVQTVTPALAQGLGLRRSYGVMISDVFPGSPAEAAGLRPRDIIGAVDGNSISTLPFYTAMMYLHDPSTPVVVKALRGDQTLQFQVPAVSADDGIYREISIDPHQSLIPELGIFGKTVNSTLALKNGLRSETGVYVVATTGMHEDSGMGLAPGDVIASVNGAAVADEHALRSALQSLEQGKSAVVQVERHGLFVYIERELDPRPPEAR